MKRILFCTSVPITKSLGAAKVVVELAEEMHSLSWECNIICPSDISAPTDDDPLSSFSANLRGHLRCHGSDYDVVDYDHPFLPYKRDQFSQQTLFVARSVLLAHHLETISVPRPPGIKAALGELAKGRARRQRRQKIVCQAHTTVKEADLVNVSNTDDKSELLHRDIPEEKVVVIPYGISQTRRPMFDRVSSSLPKRPIVAFVGTFDYRKGAREFPQIVRAIVQQVPDVTFRFLGVQGLFQTEQEILSHFPKGLVEKVKVVMKYAPEELPGLLAPCSVGVFPSYMEGFGFGVLEMLAASIPVVAYDAPGPPMMLPSEYLVARGDAKALSIKVVELLTDEDRLSSSRAWAKQRSQQFSWKQAANMTNDAYLEALQRLRNPSMSLSSKQK